jgi:alkylation response protein AidB-like acyl-CoA dehydrogenase
VYLAGLTAVVDIAFDHRGDLYILEIASGLVPGPNADPGVGNGRLLRKRRGAATADVLLDNLVFPRGLRLDRTTRSIHQLRHFLTAARFCALLRWVRAM